MDTAQFNASVCNVIRMIPLRKVTTCAHIAELLGEPTKSRQVSEVVEFLGQTSSFLPWYRVISAPGIIASHGDLGRVQKTTLEREGVHVFAGLYGELCIELNQFGWFPDHVFIVSKMDSEDEWGA